MVIIRKGRPPCCPPPGTCSFCFRLTLLGAMCMVHSHCLLHPTVAQTSSPGGDIAHCPPSCACSREPGYHHLHQSGHGDQQRHPRTLIPESPWKRTEGRKRGKLASYRLLSLSPSSRHNFSKKAFATALLYQKEQLEHSSLNQTKRSTPCNTAELQCSLAL